MSGVTYPACCLSLASLSGDGLVCSFSGVDANEQVWQTWVLCDRAYIIEAQGGVGLSKLYAVRKPRRAPCPIPFVECGLHIYAMRLGPRRPTRKQLNGNLTLMWEHPGGSIGYGGLGNTL
jgi:hypothetical protein